MGKRYEERYGRGYRRDRDRADDRGYRGEERGYMDRAGDEVRSWFGDEDAERRRRMDEERERQRERRYGSDWNRSDRSRANANRSDWNRSYRTRSDWDRSDWDRSDWNRSDWNRSDWNRSEWNRPEGSRGMSSGDWRRRDSERSGSDWDRDRGVGRYGAVSQYRDMSQYGRSDELNRYRDRYRDEDMDRNREMERYERPVGGGTWSADEGRMEFGQRWGRGPKGYQRSDNRIQEDVNDRLTYSEVDAENIEVSVTNGEVTLSGFVRDRWDKRRAEDLAEEVSGVRDVHNNIRVDRGERGLGQSDKSASDQPGTVLGVNPTAGSNITSGTAPRTGTGTAGTQGTTGSTSTTARR